MRSSLIGVKCKSAVAAILMCNWKSYEQWLNRPCSSCFLLLSTNQFCFLTVLFQNVALAPLGHINSKHLVVNQAAAKVCALIRMRQLHAKSMHQLRPYLGWNIVGMRRINVMVEHQAPEQHFPVIANEAH